jgi:hypothetical protein
MADLQAQALGLPKIILATGSVTKNNNTTLADATGMAFAIAASEIWFVEVFAMVTGASINSDYKFGWTVPASCTAEWGAIGYGGAAMPGWISVPAANTAHLAFLAVGATLICGSIAGKHGIQLAGIFTNSTNAGTVQLQFAQGTTTVENTVFQQTNSFLRVTRLA